MLRRSFQELSNAYFSSEIEHVKHKLWLDFSKSAVKIMYFDQSQNSNLNTSPRKSYQKLLKSCFSFEIS